MKKNCDFASGSGTNAENIISILQKETGTVVAVLQTTNAK
jgi:folate-dependent phosphoribosylglycinamide formyltransferase PurN